MSTWLPTLLLTLACLTAAPIFAVLLECAAALFPRRPAAHGARPRIDVLIPAHNEERVLAATLRSVQAQLRPGDRILVVAHNCDDGTAEVARTCGVDVVERRHETGRGKAFALDFGVRQLNARNGDVVVNHGKTTLVDKIIHECKAMDPRKETGQLNPDNNELKRERGNTILSKNVAVSYNGIKINIIDTPGHSDFGGEVERVLNLADGALLLVDAFEGPMPQTRFVLQKAIEMGLKIILVINKVDKENCRPEEVESDVFDLMFNLGATEDQLDFVTLFGSGRDGWMSFDHNIRTKDIQPLLQAVADVIPDAPYKEGTVQMGITSLDYNNFQGRIAIGRVLGVT